MKALLTTIAILAATTFVAPTALAADAPGELASYNLPIGAANLKAGQAVRPVFTEEFQKAAQSLVEKINALPEDKKAAIVTTLDLSVLPAYNPDLWADQAAYNAYKAALKQTKIEPSQVVGVSLQSLGKDTWRLNSVTVDQNQRSAPLTLGALSYNARSNSWTSNNGELSPKPYSTTDDSIYGAQTGTEWRLEKSDDFSKVVEFIRFSKTKDGKFIYIVYGFQETSIISNASIAQGGYTLRFPVK